MPLPLRIIPVLGLLSVVSLPAQQPNSVAATLLVDGVTGSLARAPSASLRMTLRGAPGVPVLLAEGVPGPPLAVPALGGVLEIGIPFAFHLDGLNAGSPLYAWSFTSPLTGEIVWSLPFAPPGGNAPTAFQAIVADPGGTPSGFRLTASTTVTPMTPATIPAWPVAISRGPILEQLSSTSVLVTVRVDPPAPLTIDVGIDGTNWLLAFASAATTADHSVMVSGLTPGTAYRYRVRSGADVLAEGPAFALRTPPPAGSPESLRVVAWGDCGTGNSGQIMLSRPMDDLAPRPALGLVLGDVIYPSGNAEYYDDNFFLPYRSLLASLPLWPAIGNHDALTSGGAPYFAAFNLPTASSGTENYYSFDAGNVHFVALDTALSLTPGHPMFSWLAADLAASTQTWKIAFFHHAPYSGGTHGDNPAVQALVVPVLEAGGIDLVVTGHSHVMERTFLLQNHAIIQNDPSTYDKTSSPLGAVYVIAGSGGAVGPLSNPVHPLMAFQLGDTLGELVLDVQGPNLRGYHQTVTGQAVDHFSITKGPDTIAPRPGPARMGASPAVVDLAFDEPVEAGTGPRGAENLANYRLDGLSTPLAATVLPDRRRVTLTFPPLAVGQAHTLLVLPVNDRAALPQASLPVTLPIAVEPWRRVVLPGGSWKVRDGLTVPPASWADRDFDDSAWFPARAPIGYGTTEPVTTVIPMAGLFLAFYARTAFSIADPTLITGLDLAVNFDDGFVAFLNGHEIARRGVAVGQTPATPGRDHESYWFESFVLPQACRFLLPGRNVLAIEVHNVSLTSSDCILDAMMSLTGPGSGFGLRASANGVSAEDHGTTVPIPVAGPLFLRAECPPALPGAIQWTLSSGLRAELGPGSVLLPPEVPFLNAPPGPGGLLDVLITPLPPSLIGVSLVVQAFQSAPGQASNALRLAFVP